MRRALYADWEAPGRPGPGSDIWDLGAGREACETSCGALLSSLAPPPAKPAWAQSPQGEMMATRCPKGSSASKFRSRSKGRLVASWLRTCS